MRRLIRLLITLAGLGGLWHLAYEAVGRQAYLLPSPAATALALWTRGPLIAGHALTTAAEIVLGLLVGGGLGMACALALAASKPLRLWLLPLVVASQAVPVFALAPLLVLWLGFGMASKVAMAGLIIFFPVTVAFYDGLRRTEPGWLDLARVMGASPLRVLWRLRLPAALPGLASGLRVAAAVAPIGAVIGEWVGASSGLGYLMLHANARSQIDLMFAALVVLAAMGIALHALVDALARRLLPWVPHT